MAGVRQFDERVALERALDLFKERGFRATSMPELAAATGVQRGSLYHAYGGKEEIFLCAFDAYATGFLAGATAALGRPSRREALLSLFDYCIATFAGGTPAHGCLSTRTAVEAATESPRAETAVRAMLDRLEEIVCTRLAELPETPSPLDPRAAARLVVATTRGLAVMERATYDADELRAIARTLVRALLGA
ncbi:TetR family transcriptional regulator [Amycolatopsis sp. A1MSW2902]|uniref:TetR/AcrR family transcriptional regulator n=1 Tax=Amycolatopsis sp. A1MSW2902 TaxID=687413 RepID=UPI00307DA4B5